MTSLSCSLLIPPPPLVVSSCKLRFLEDVSGHFRWRVFPTRLRIRRQRRGVSCVKRQRLVDPPLPSPLPPCVTLALIGAASRCLDTLVTPPPPGIAQDHTRDDRFASLLDRRCSSHPTAQPLPRHRNRAARASQRSRTHSQAPFLNGVPLRFAVSAGWIKGVCFDVRSKKYNLVVRVPENYREAPPDGAPASPSTCVLNRPICSLTIGEPRDYCKIS